MQAEPVERLSELPQVDNSIICPCCLQFVEGVTVLADPITCRIVVGSKSVRMKRQQFDMARYLLDAFPLMAPTERLMTDVFKGRRGRTLKRNISAVIASQLRPIMADLGFSVETIRGSGYRLVRHQQPGGNA